MSTARRPPVALFAVLAALAIAACGEDRDEEGTATSAKTETSAKQASGVAVATVKVSETEYALDPADPKVSKSGVIQFDVSNDGKTEHALEVEGSSGEAQTKSIAPGGKATLKTQLEPGTYEWYCPIGNHKDLGMKGRIKVAGGGGSSTGTTTDETETGDDKGGESGNSGSGSGGSSDPYE